MTGRTTKPHQTTPAKWTESVQSVEPPPAGLRSSEDHALSVDQPHVALPKLYGAPAYARPPMPVAASPRPFDPDELPIEATMSEDEREFAASLPARAYAPGGDHHGAREAASRGRNLRPRKLSVRAIAGRLLRNERPGRGERSGR